MRGVFWFGLGNQGIQVESSGGSCGHRSARLTPAGRRLLVHRIGQGGVGRLPMLPM